MHLFTLLVIDKFERRLGGVLEVLLWQRRRGRGEFNNPFVRTSVPQFVRFFVSSLLRFILCLFFVLSCFPPYPFFHSLDQPEIYLNQTLLKFTEVKPTGVWKLKCFKATGFDRICNRFLSQLHQSSINNSVLVILSLKC